MKRVIYTACLETYTMYVCEIVIKLHKIYIITLKGRIKYRQSIAWKVSLFSMKQIK
jgi:hypothetical protein